MNKRRRTAVMTMSAGVAAFIAVLASCVPGRPGGGGPGANFPPQVPPPVPGGITNAQIGNYLEGTNRPIPSTPGEGAYRAICQVSHYSNDDPIVYPRQPGAAHLHMYFGNSLANAYSTDTSLLTTGNGTCNGGPLNRSGYWIPALFDANNKVRVPDYILLYYKTGALAPNQMRAFPQGLKMIVGDANATTAQSTTFLDWDCGSTENNSPTIPVCPRGGELKAGLAFPTCWNGRDLDSPNHRSHVVHGTYGTTGVFHCPPGFPVVLPEVAFIAHWQNPDQSTAGWYLASDRHHGVVKPGGLTLHGDWWGAWQPTVMNSLVQNCLKGQLSCQDGELGNGTRMKSAPVYTGPSIINPPGPA